MKAKAWWLLGWLALTAIVIAAARVIDFRGALDALGSADPGWIVLAVLINALVLPIATLQWQLLLPRGETVPPRRMFSILALTASISNGGPPFAGHAAGIRLLATRGGLGHATGVSVTILDQLAEGFAKIVLIAAAAALVPGFEYRTVGLVLVLGVPALALGFLALALRSAPIQERAARASGPSARALRFLGRAIHKLDALRRPAHFGLAVALAVAKKGVEGLALAMVAAALGLTLPLWVVVAVLVATSLSILVAPTPAGLGVWEASAFLVLRAAGVAAEPALALALVAHAAHLAPLVLTGWGIESARLWKRARAGVVGLAALAAIGLAIHVWFVLGADALDSDRALVLLMARDFAHGAWSVYFWQQNYMAAVEPLLLSPLAALGWATPVAAGLVALALTAALATLAVRMARSMGGTTWMALLIWAVPPAVVVHHHVSLYGARLACTLLAVAAFAWSLRCRTARGWMGAGALVGLAYFGDHLMLPWAAAVVFVAGARGALKHAALGALIPVALDTALAAVTPAAHLSGPNDPGEWLANVPLLFGTTLPQLFGLLLSRGPGPLFEEPASVVPQGSVWLVPVLLGGAALALLGGTLVRERRWLFDDGPPSRRLAVRALLLVCLTSLGLFAFVGGGGDRWPVRYLVPLWPALSVLAALAASRWRPRLRPLAALAVLPAAFTVVADHTWPRGADGVPAREEAAVVGRAVRESGARAVWAEYWDTYRMALLAGESTPWLALRVIERRPDRAREATAASPVAYLVRHADAEILGRLDQAGTQGIRRLEDVAVGRYRLVVLERAVAGAVLISEPPDRSWQALAALSAGLLFLGTLVVAGSLPRIPALRRLLPPLLLLLACAAPAPAGAQSTAPRDSVAGRSPEFTVLRGYSYGSDAIISPLTVVLSRGYEITQARNHRRDFWTYRYGDAAGAVFDALRHPAAAVERGGGWIRWIRSEILPFAIEPNEAKWFPNYTEHLIDGGLTARALSDWYRARGFPHPKVWGGATIMTSAVLNEIMENRGEQVGSSSTVADIYVFDLGGVFLLQWDPLARFLIEELRMSDWSPLRALTFPNGEIHNTGQYFVYKIPLPFLEQTRLFWRLGLGSQVGLTFPVDAEHNLSFGGGVDTELRHVDPVTLEETIEVVRSAGIFWDRNDSLLASLMVSQRFEDMIAVNIYPGVLPGVGGDVGLWLTASREGAVRFGLAHRRALGLAIGLGW